MFHNSNKTNQRKTSTTIDANQCPDKMSGLLLTLLGQTPVELPGEWSLGFVGSSEAWHHLLHQAPHPVMWHYVHPRRMIGAEQWAVHREFDQRVNQLHGIERLWVVVVVVCFKKKLIRMTKMRLPTVEWSKRSRFSSV
jgi:hypothetical protein